MNIKAAAPLALLLLLGACANKTADASATTGSGSIAPQGPAPGSQDDLANNVGDKVFYATDSSGLSGDARSTLDRQAAWLGRYPQVQVQMGGNCDERGTTEYNLALGQRRAGAARDYLVAHGVASARVTAVSYGKERPIAVGSDEAAWAQNRNATTSVR